MTTSIFLRKEKLCEKDNYISYLFVSLQVLIWSRYTVDSLRNYLMIKVWIFPMNLIIFTTITQLLCKPNLRVLMPHVILLFHKIEPNESEAETLENVYLTDNNRND